MGKIIIIGYGGLTIEVKNLIDNINMGKTTFEFLGYLVGDLDKLGECDSKDEAIGVSYWLLLDYLLRVFSVSFIILT